MVDDGSCTSKGFWGVPQLFIKRDNDANISMILAKVTDDFLMVSSANEITKFIEQIGKRFPIIKAIVDDDVKFNGNDISQNQEGKIRLSMDTYLNEMEPVIMSTECKKHRIEQSGNEEMNAFRSLACEFVCLRSSALPHASYVGSWMQQKFPMIKIENIIQANGRLKEAKEMCAFITFRPPPPDIVKFVITSFSDASFNVTKS